jgi:hypothetical protein
MDILILSGVLLVSSISFPLPLLLLLLLLYILIIFIQDALVAQFTHSIPAWLLVRYIVGGNNTGRSLARAVYYLISSMTSTLTAGVY